MERQELVEEMIFAGDKAGKGYCVEEEQARAMLQVILDNIDSVVYTEHNCSCPPCGCGYRLKPSFRKDG